MFFYFKNTMRGAYEPSNAKKPESQKGASGRRDAGVGNRRQCLVVLQIRDDNADGRGGHGEEGNPWHCGKKLLAFIKSEAGTEGLVRVLCPDFDRTIAAGTQ